MDRASLGHKVKYSVFGHLNRPTLVPYDMNLSQNFYWKGCQCFPSTDSSSKKSQDDTDFDEAFKELCDPLVPVRGHAIVAISKLLYKRNPKALSHSDALLKIFTDQLSHDDSYIYLAAVQGLVALSSIKTDQVLPHLAREFATCRKETDKENDGNAISRKKLLIL